MNGLLRLMILLLFVLPGQAQTKGYIDSATKEFSLIGNIKSDYRIFGYAKPDSKSEKVILFSVFTSDVKDNPHKLPLGSYYQTSNLKEGDKIEYVCVTAKFVKLNFITSSNKITAFYIARRFIEFL